MEILKPRVGVGVLVFNSKQQLLLGKRLNAHGESSWGPCGGHLEFKESFEDCAIREVFEETNLVIKSPQFLAITNDFFENEGKHYVSILMTANYLGNQNVLNNEPNKVENWGWFDLDNLPENLFLPVHKLLNGMSYGKKLELPSYL